MVDSGATRNFVKQEITKLLNLWIETGVNTFEALNSKVDSVVGLDSQVPLNIGEWKGVVKFAVIPLDEFDVVLGHEFMKKEKETPMPT